MSDSESDLDSSSEAGAHSGGEYNELTERLSTPQPTPSADETEDDDEEEEDMAAMMLRMQSLAIADAKSAKPRFEELTRDASLSTTTAHFVRRSVSEAPLPQVETPPGEVVRSHSRHSSSEFGIGQSRMAVHQAVNTHSYNGYPSMQTQQSQPASSLAIERSTSYTGLGMMQSKSMNAIEMTAGVSGGGGMESGGVVVGSVETPVGAGSRGSRGDSVGLPSGGSPHPLTSTSSGTDSIIAEAAPIVSPHHPHDPSGAGSVGVQSLQMIPDVFTSIALTPYDTLIDNINTIQGAELDPDRRKMWDVLKDLIEREKNGEMTDASKFAQTMQHALYGGAEIASGVPGLAESVSTGGGTPRGTDELLAAIHSMTRESRKELRQIREELHRQRWKNQQLKQKLKKERSEYEKSEANRKVVTDRLTKHEPSLVTVIYKDDANMTDMSMAVAHAPIAYSREEMVSLHHALRSRRRSSLKTAPSGGPAYHSLTDDDSSDGLEDEEYEIIRRKKRSQSGGSGSRNFFEWLGSGGCGCSNNDTAY